MTTRKYVTGGTESEGYHTITRAATARRLPGVHAPFAPDVGRGVPCRRTEPLPAAKARSSARVPRSMAGGPQLPS